MSFDAFFDGQFGSSHKNNIQKKEVSILNVYCHPESSLIALNNILLEFSCAGLWGGRSGDQQEVWSLVIGFWILDCPDRPVHRQNLQLSGKPVISSKQEAPLFD
jgi:hypothetical protein